MPDETPVAGGSADVLVAGGGNAGLVAALEARAAGADVLLLERAAREWRGGNTKYTRNIRCAHAGYPEEELLADLAQVTGSEIDRELAEIAVRESASVPRWMESQGVSWQPAFRGTLHLDRTNRFFLGGGKALVNSYYRKAESAGVRVCYGATVESLLASAQDISVQVVRAGTRETVRARAVVVASGGFEANLDWLQRYWGEGARNYIVRGARQNDGLLLKALFDLGAAERGNRRGFHAVACDARSPKYEGGIVTRVDAIPFGVVLNREGRRFYDEGED